MERRPISYTANPVCSGGDRCELVDDVTTEIIKVLTARRRDTRESSMRAPRIPHLGSWRFDRFATRWFATFADSIGTRRNGHCCLPLMRAERDSMTNIATLKSVETIEAVRIPVESVTLDADLRVPTGARGLVIFAHGSGSSRFSRRNRQVAQFLGDRGFATLLLDLLTAEEERVDVETTEFRFDIPRLGPRVSVAADWAAARTDIGALPIGCFGASTGAAAALIAAAERPQRIAAVVSRGGRPDLAGEALRRVKAPTRLIVGGDDEPVIELNRAAMRQMSGHVELEIVAGATHLFEEAGTLERVAALAAGWFHRYLRGRTLGPRGMES
jgi:putative phosphoribosyl transferase